jgi:hypothetical protein
MPKALMPQVDRRGAGQQRLWMSPERIQLAVTVTSEHLLPGWKILNRKTTGIKLYRHIVITSEGTH